MGSLQREIILDPSHIQRAKQFVTPLLLPLKDWRYHGGSDDGTYHSFQEVLAASTQISQLIYGDNTQELYQVQLAAIFHDVGLVTSDIHKYEDHEKRSEQVFRRFAQTIRMNQSLTDTIAEGILESNIAIDDPQTDIGRVLRDADIAYLGMPNPFKRIADLREEVRMHHHGFLTDKSQDDKVWWDLQVQFVGNDRLWKTGAATQLYEANRLNNFVQVQQKRNQAYQRAA